MNDLRTKTAFILTAGAAFLGGCTISTPFQGPTTSTSADSGERTAVVAITYARLGSGLGAYFQFWKQIGPVVEAAKRQPGYLGHSLRRSVFGGEAWTITAWSDEESLMAFVRSEAHQRAMRQGAAALDKTRFVRLAIDRADLPLEWDRADQLLAANAAQSRALVRQPLAEPLR